MALLGKNNTKEKLDGYNSRAYFFVKLTYTILSILNAIVVIASFQLVGWSLYDAQRSYAAITEVQTSIFKTNTEIVKLLSDPYTMDDTVKEVTDYFAKVDSAKEDFEKISRPAPEIKERFDKACSYIEEYRALLKKYQSQYVLAEESPELLEQFAESLPRAYDTEVGPLMNRVTKEMDAAVEQQREDTTNIFFKTAQSFLLVIILLILIYVVGIISLIRMDKAAKRAALELKKRADEIEETSKKLSKSRSKTKAVAFTNILTGLKNRYALEEDLSSRLETENFHIVNFDIDNFRTYNETYGRDFGDELLSTISEKLKTEFSQYAEIYNITCDEFSFVFNTSISPAQAMDLTQKIAVVMSSAYTIYNITVQVTVSGCAYHYTAGECTSLNSLLLKMDNAMHAAKSNGGNTIFEANKV